MSTRIASSSLIYVRVPITADHDPTGDTVTMAFLPAYLDVQPGSGDYVSADWAGPAIPPSDINPRWTADSRCLVGAGGAITLTAGVNYRVWTKIVDSPETPVLASDILTVF